jgi:hypothetical protein
MVRVSKSILLKANPSTRSPAEAARAILERHAGSWGMPESASSSSGAPLTKSIVCPSGPRCRVAMKRYAASKGTSSRRGHSARTCSALRPAFIASAISAPSIGSPSTVHTPSRLRSCASLHSSPQRMSGIAEATQAASSSWPTASMLPSGA